MLEEQVLEKKTHDRSAFTCGVPALDDYLKLQAAQHVAKGITVVRVLVESTAPRTILGYYTLSAAEIDRESLPTLMAKPLPKFPVPCVRLGRLAVAGSEKGKGYGATLLGLAFTRALETSEAIGAYAMIVDAKDSQAASFYSKHGFIQCVDNSLLLFKALKL